MTKTDSDRSKTSYMITVETDAYQANESTGKIDRLCQGRKKVMAEDVSVTEDLYEMLLNGHMVTMSEPHRRKDDNSMECDVRNLHRSKYKANLELCRELQILPNQATHGRVTITILI